MTKNPSSSFRRKPESSDGVDHPRRGRGNQSSFGPGFRRGDGNGEGEARRTRTGDTTSIGFLLVPGFALMSYAAAIEPLRAANQLSGKRLYTWWHAAPGGAPVAASNGVSIIPDSGTDRVREADIVFVCAGGNPSTFDDARTFAWLRRLARRGIALGGISGGPYVLARAGLLGGRRATLHWEHAPAFREAFPEVEVVPSLFEIDGDRITCSGGVSALDMMVALIARDRGHQLAAAVGDWFLLTHVREGMGPQRMDLRFRLGIADEKLLAVLRAMEANLERPIPRPALARSAGVSLRQLERLFRRHVGRSIHEHYRALRLERARLLLRESPLAVIDVAVVTGFGSASQFSRAYRRAYGEPPSATRGGKAGR
jgi:AraC family carnitine catabolism transcriptional activator